MLRRKPVPPGVRSKGKIKTFPNPERGWITNDNLAKAKPGGAKVLDNLWPELNSLKLRGGNVLWATVHATDPCESLFAYRYGTTTKLFGATATNIYEISNPVSPTVIPSASLTGITNGDFSSANFTTAGGGFIVAVNGADRMIEFDGATWRYIDSATLELPFDAQTVNYGGGGLTVTGGTSGATGVIVETIDNGTTGTLRLKSVVGTFVDNELVTASTGSATSNIPSGATAVPAITGATTTSFSHVWVFKSRLFFLKKDSLNAYALNTVDSLGGAVIDISLGGVMQKGGSLVIGATWSTDAGDGMDDMCVFISDQGEIAVYQGSDPSDSTVWSLVGVYQMPAPMHKNAVAKAGGNLLVATEMGLIPISSAVKKDLAAIPVDAISLPIEPTWKSYIAARQGKWVVAKWGSKNRAFVGFPVDSEGVTAAFGLNLQTGAWARMTGFDMRCAVELDGELYFGTSDGMVMKADSAATDNGTQYYGLYVGLDEMLSNIAQEKVALMTRPTWRSSTTFRYKISFGFDYEYTLPSYPSSPSVATSDVWDTGLWDQAVWDASGVSRISTEWEGTCGAGFVVAPIIQISAGGTDIPDIELISIDLLYETGTIVT